LVAPNPRARVRRDAELGQQTDPRNATRWRRLLAAVAASVLAKFGSGPIPF
jgi:hypothetical protein